MDSEGDREQKGHDPRRRSYHFEDTYLFNATSGLYEPKGYARQDTVNRKVPGTVKKHPFFTHTNRDWLTMLILMGGLLVSIATLILLAITIQYAHRQWQETKRTADASVIGSNAAKDAADAAVAANRISRENFRTDQRPYLVSAVFGTPSEIFIVTTGSHAGELRFSVHLMNYGRTPAVVNAVFLHTFVGESEIAKIGTSETSESGKFVIPAGDKPILYAYSDKLTPDQLAIISSHIQAIPIPIVIYGHIEYTDIFPKPNPLYSTGLCGQIADSEYAEANTKVCSGRQYIR